MGSDLSSMTTNSDVPLAYLPEIELVAEANAPLTLSLTLASGEHRLKKRYAATREAEMRQFVAKVRQLQAGATSA